ncbi:neurofilament medium polypeptide-like [Helianthus annuus]|uniref:neurofilament medium polypeptide-like n=1 Tax=Helianthus annuus TaxID=4232 RepID=UPI000B8FE5D6|nr:neurofilament medium polypeptide-like [Helianthus annuus]
MWSHYTQKYPDGVEAALNLKLRSIEDELPENIDVTFSSSDTDNESQVIKTVVDQVLDEESEKSEKAQSEKVVSNSEDEGNFLDQYILKSVFKPKEKLNEIFVVGPSVDDEKDYIFSQKAVDDFNAAKKLKEESVKSTFVEYDKRVCYRCSEIGHMAKQCQKVIEKLVQKSVVKPSVQKPIVVKPVQKQTVSKPTVPKSNVQKPRPKSPTDTKGKKPMASPIRILKRGESLKSEDKPKSIFEIGESSNTRKT